VQIGRSGSERRGRAALGAAAGAALALLASAGAARADDACVGAYEATQVARKDGRLLDARREALVCSQPACPKGMVSECAAWLGEIEQALPSVVLAFEMPDGSDVLGARVTIDGAVTEAGGRAIPLDPGAHAVRVALDGFEPLEQRFVLKEGEQRRRITGRLVAAAATTTPARWPAFVAGGVSVAAFGVAIGVGAAALSDFEALSARCEPRCPSADVAGLRGKAIAADVALGVGAASLAVAAVLFFRPAPATTIRAGATAGGGVLRFERTF
jgi:hypothetical protein